MTDSAQSLCPECGHRPDHHSGLYGCTAGSAEHPCMCESRGTWADWNGQPSRWASAVRVARDIHKPKPLSNRGYSVCAEDGFVWPCATARALGVLDDCPPSTHWCDR